MRRILILAPLALASAAYADEPAAVLELGGAAEVDTSESQSHFGPAIAVEVTPIEDLLELELGVSALRVAGSTEWESDLLFKKPFDLSPTPEIMAGLGPSWTHASAPEERPNSLGAEFAFDVMFWRTRTHQWGWYLEPSYSIGLDSDHSKSVGLTAGLIFSIP